MTLQSSITTGELPASVYLIYAVTCSHCKPWNSKEHVC